MEYSIDSLEDLQKKIAHIENELSDINNQIALIIAKSNKDKERPPLSFSIAERLFGCCGVSSKDDYDFHLEIERFGSYKVLNEYGYIIRH